MTTTLYGIPNCDTVKKARTWLADNGHDFTFHDFKKQGLSRELVQGWLKDLDWETLVNRKGMTWRNLSDERYRAGGYNFPGALTGDSVIGFYGAPRTVTLSVTANF